MTKINADRPVLRATKLLMAVLFVLASEVASAQSAKDLHLQELETQADRAELGVMRRDAMQRLHEGEIGDILVNLSRKNIQEANAIIDDARGQIDHLFESNDPNATVGENHNGCKSV